MSEKEKTKSRRDFIQSTARFGIGLLIGGIGGVMMSGSTSKATVWQLDPNKCVQCGRCATSCVVTPSAVKCVHVYEMCGYCDLCGGYFKPTTKNLTTGAENQLCPTAALERVFIEEPYFEYHINEELCFGCGKCVKGCEAFGNGSLHLQVRHDICVDCNECTIAQDCPADAFSRIPADEPYLFKNSF